MKFLADMGISVSTVQALRSDGHDAVHLRDEGLIRLADEEILNNGTPNSVTAHVRNVVTQRRRELEEGALVIVEDARHRVRRLPLEP